MTPETVAVQSPLSVRERPSGNPVAEKLRSPQSLSESVAEREYVTASLYRADWSAMGARFGGDESRPLSIASWRSSSSFGVSRWTPSWKSPLDWKGRDRTT